MVATVTRKPVKRAGKKAPAKRAKARTGERSPEWKANMAFGRDAARAIDAYLEALDAPRRRIPSEKKLANLKTAMESAKGVKRILARQQLTDAEIALVAASGGGASLTEAEKGFIEFAKRWSEAKGITYGTWREAGVPARVLKAAGITQTRLG